MKILNVLFSKLLVNRVAGVCVLRPSTKDDEADGADEVSPVPTLSVEPLAGGVLPPEPIYALNTSNVRSNLLQQCEAVHIHVNIRNTL